MRMIFALFLAAGIGLAVIAVYMAQGQIAQFQAERDHLAAMQAKFPKLANVVVSKKEFKYGQRFTPDDLTVIKVQADAVPPGAFTRIHAKMGTPEAKTAIFLDGETRPRAMLRSIEPFEPVLASKVTDPGVDAGIMANLAPNRRAFTIQVSVATGVSGFLRPGSLVDVYWSGTIDGEPVTKLIESNLKLIAIDQSADADRSSATQIANTVTAEVTPEQVAALTLAQSTGRLTLSLVGALDTEQVGKIEIDRNQLLGIQEKKVEKVVEKKKCTITTRRGSDVIQTEIPCTN
ncbi:Flp pilus assembly protein CpaB [Thioclava sp. BHET1]|uniref:Pilus assembly protein CpaB n=1 Tax=Thioclava dalianensis TaxID=1185766 RepID=A0A074T909_9RHOB|nr:Flp pilus assembly protein CpaB [Thioclava dalianensis]KEP68246.1 pilus assembly protein CpaB [Thioclava dalianensis]TMV94805.1 Flp pilus assembly protein CpaB [Thioclava sp. BHET1]SFM89780.1 pilus assembly protein CpaB [Thioclava dalianensis]